MSIPYVKLIFLVHGHYRLLHAHLVGTVMGGKNRATDRDRGSGRRRDRGAGTVH